MKLSVVAMESFEHRPISTFPTLILYSTSILKLSFGASVTFSPYFSSSAVISFDLSLGYVTRSASGDSFSVSHSFSGAL